MITKILLASADKFPREMLEPSQRVNALDQEDVSPEEEGANR